MIGPSVQARHAVVQRQRDHRERVVVPAQVLRQEPVQRGMGHDGIVRDVEIIVPVQESIAEAGNVDGERDGEDRAQPDQRGRARARARSRSLRDGGTPGSPRVQAVTPLGERVQTSAVSRTKSS